MYSHRWHRLSLITVIMLLISIVAPLGAAGQGAVEVQAPVRLVPQTVKPSAERLGEVQAVEDTAEKSLDKLDPQLRDLAQAGGKELVEVYAKVSPGTDLSRYMQRMIKRPVVFGELETIYGYVRSGDLLALAGQANVANIIASGSALRDTPYDAERADVSDRAPAVERMNELKANEVPYSALAASEGPEAAGWFDVKDGHKSSEAWKKGFEGQGVIVGVLDDGIDFGHPDLQGTYARVTDESSPYYGWPMAFSQVSMKYFVEEVNFQDLGAEGITQGWNGSRWSDTQTERTIHNPQGPMTGTVTYEPLGAAGPYEYLVPKTSQSGTYKLGSLPEKNLLAVFGERVAILVVDEDTAGEYDTVYVDLDDDYDFTDEKPVTQASPEVYRDMDGDGYADISGGALVWISDGDNVPPTADWLWGVSCGIEVGSLKACPDSGSLLLFAGAFDAGYTHGTQCASNIAGQGKVSGGLTAQPFRTGGMVQGAAPEVGLMDFGNHYYQGTDEDEYLVAAVGYDGWSNSGDEVQITSNSYGNFTQMWGGWGYFGRLVTALNTTIAPSTMWVFSAGNEGPGYGPQEGDSGPTTLKVGSSTQYGSTNWDSIYDIEQIVYGDVTSFFSKGPSRDGSSGLDLLANGGRGSGDEGLNYYGFDGATSWATWGGTSRSAPVAAGNLALVYQAYKARYGAWPTWDVAMALIKSGADDASSSPFFQGAGVVNADRATDLAAGIYGVYATPDEWQVGDWNGTEYLNFAKVAKPGEVYNKTYTLTNPSSYDIDVDVADGVMQLIDSTELSFTTKALAQESAFNFHSPDYLMKLDPALIPPDAELMIVRYVHDYSSFDSSTDFTPNPNSSWRFMVYNWTDQNDDGKLWVDQNGNGVVNHTDVNQWDNDGFKRLDFANSDIQEGEYVRMDYEFGGLAVPIMIRDPLERMADGYYFGWQHRYSSAAVQPTTFKIGVEFYKRADWDWLNLSDGSVFVPAEGQATFDAQAVIPADAAPGAYEGVIYLNVPGDMFHVGYETALPVVVNVIADLPDDGSVTLGGGPLADTLYQNGYVNGYFNWYGGGWTGAGDWRHFFVNVDEADVAKGYLLVHTSWDAGYPTDLNTWVLGPTDDCASAAAEPCAWYQPGLGQPAPWNYGPYTLQPIAWSDPFMAGSAYPFHTSTGENDDWLLVPVTTPGLYAIAVHNVLYDGEELAAQFQIELGTMSVESSMNPAEGKVVENPVEFEAYDEAGEILFQFTPTIGFDHLVAMLAGGLGSSQEDHETLLADSEQCDSGAACAETVWTAIEVDQAGARELTVSVDMPAGEDMDLFVYRDMNGNDIFDLGTDMLVGASTNGAGVDDTVVKTNPALGTYLVGILGWDLSAPTMNADWYHRVIYPENLPTEVVWDQAGTVAVDQDTAGNYHTASYSTTVTVNERTAAYHAFVGSIPAGSNVDLYVTDSSNAVVDQSTNAGNADETVDLLPVGGNYRLEEGETYTFWVVGATMPAPANVQLNVWHDELNLWLSSADGDVKAMEVSPGETLNVTLHYSKEGWDVGDGPLSASLVAGPEGLPNAFERIFIINRADAPGEPQWDPENLIIQLTADSGRGPSPVARWNVGGAPISTALIAPTERVTYTVYMENTDALPTPELIADVWPLPEDYLGMYYGMLDRTDGADYGLVLGTHNTVDYNGGIQWWGVLGPGHKVQFSYWVEMPFDMALGGDHTSGVDVYDADTWEWYGWDLAGAYYRAARFGWSGKWSDKASVIPGEEFTYTVELINSGAQDMDVTFVDPLPEEVEYLSHSGGGSYNPGTHTITWDTMMPGDTSSQFLTIQVRAKSDLEYGTIIWNDAYIRDRYSETVLYYLSVGTYVDTGAALVLDKQVNSLVAAYGDTLRYTITLSNDGIEAAHGVTVRDVIPAYLDVIPGSIWVSKASSDGPIFQTLPTAIHWEGDLAIGETLTIRWSGKVNTRANRGLALINAATAMADNYPTELYSSAVTEILFMSKNYMPLMFRMATLQEPN